MAKSHTLDDVNSLLYQTLDDLVNPDTDEKGDVINEVTPNKAKAIIGVANAIVNSNKLQLEAIKMVNTGSLTVFGNDTIKTKLLGE
jgi:hypothetical protein